ncbi:MAG: hypothetical protein HYY68_00980 [Thaumarchaeota archaeon]|nr:hypothetical protein [Nitrososphaerota archaeon]
MLITQNEKDPLLDYVEGAELDGVRCKMYYAKSTEMHYATIHGLENIGKELKMILPFVRTQKKLRQIARFREYLGARRTSHQYQARRALEILDGTKASSAKLSLKKSYSVEQHNNRLPIAHGA